MGCGCFVGKSASPSVGTVQEPLVLTTGAEWGDGEGDLPSAFLLEQNYPNPFNPTTTIRFQLPSASRVTLKIFNARGQLVRTAEDRGFGAGYHRFVWDGKDNGGDPVASGVYFYRLRAGEFTDTKKMVLLR